MAAKGQIFEARFPEEAGAETVSGSIVWGNSGDRSANFRLLVNGEEIRKRIFDPGHSEVQDIARSMLDDNTYLFVVQREMGTDRWKEDDQRTVTIRSASTMIEGSFCRVDYSSAPSERAYASHIVSLADKNIPEIKSIHAGRNPDETIILVLKPILVDGSGKEYPAGTDRKRVELNLSWFDKIAEVYGSREADDGAIVHEIDHAILWAPLADYQANVWLVEGLADFVRHRRGYRREEKEIGDFSPGKGYPYYERGQADKGYQTSAHFLLYLEKKNPAVIRELYQALLEDGNSDDIFSRLLGSSKQGLIEMYERDNDRSPPLRPAEVTPLPTSLGIWSRFWAWLLGIFRR